MYEEVLEERRGPRVQGSRGPKDQDISNLHSNTSLTLKKVDLVLGLKSLTHGSHFSIGKVSLLFYPGRIFTLSYWNWIT